MLGARKGASGVSRRALIRVAFSQTNLCESRSRLENASAFEQSNRPSRRMRSARAAGPLQPVSRGGPPAVVLSSAKIPKTNAPNLIAIEARPQSVECPLLAQAEGPVALANVRRSVPAFLVHNLYSTSTVPTLTDFYNQTLVADLAAAGVKVTLADIQSLVNTVIANPTAYGFTAAHVLPGVAGAGSSTSPACVAGAGASGWGQFCGNA